MIVFVDLYNPFHSSQRNAISLSENIGCFRKANGLSQEYIADLLDMNQATYFRLEHCEAACVEQLARIAKALGTTPQTLQSYHCKDEVDSAIVTLTVSELLSQRDALIQAQAEEITFLHRQIDYLQAVWRQYCGG